jgi:GH15 family glucan-1,4-alpha-glucosidase
VTGTIDAVWSELGRDGFVSRYSTAQTDDGLSGDEGQFLACSFWLVSALAHNGRVADARQLFERLAGLSNDLGLLAEEYDPLAGRLVGNFPQAFSHVSLINSAFRLSGMDPLSMVDDGSRLLIDNTLTSATVGRMKRLGRVAIRRQTGAPR